MGKVVVFLLTCLAFTVAAVYVLLRKPIPEKAVSTATGRAFWMAVALFAAFLSAPGCGDDPTAPTPPRGGIAEKPAKDIAPAPEITLDAPLAVGEDDEEPGPDREPEPAQGIQGFINAVRDIWRNFDSAKEGVFRRAAFDAADKGLFRTRVARKLARVFSNVAEYKRRSSPGNRVKCYEMTPMGELTVRSARSVLAQVEMLRKVRSRGAIDAETARKTRIALARDVEILDRVGDKDAIDPWFELGYSSSKSKRHVQPLDSAHVAAGLVIRLEGGHDASLTSAWRRKTMANAISGILESRPSLFRDWVLSEKRIDIFKALHQIGLIADVPHIAEAVPLTPGAGTSKQRLIELRDLRSLIRAAPSSEKSGPDDAADPEIATLQARTRYVARLLVDRGEITTAMARALAECVDTEIALPSKSQALRLDTSLLLHAAFRNPPTDQVIQILLITGLVDPPRNHAHVIEWPEKAPEPTPAQALKLARFKELVGGSGPISLEEDGDIAIPSYSVPKPDREYRLKIRRVCRAALASGLVRHIDLEAIAERLGVSLFGKID